MVTIKLLYFRISRCLDANIRAQGHWHNGPLEGSEVEQRKAILSFLRVLGTLSGAPFRSAAAPITCHILPPPAYNRGKFQNPPRQPISTVSISSFSSSPRVLFPTSFDGPAVMPHCGPSKCSSAAGRATGSTGTGTGKSPSPLSTGAGRRAATLVFVSSKVLVSLSALSPRPIGSQESAPSTGVCRRRRRARFGARSLRCFRFPRVAVDRG